MNIHRISEAHLNMLIERLFPLTVAAVLQFKPNEKLEDIPLAGTLWTNKEDGHHAVGLGLAEMNGEMYCLVFAQGADYGIQMYTLAEFKKSMHPAFTVEVLAPLESTGLKS